MRKPRHLLVLTADTVKLAREIGNGNLSHGVRVAVRLAHAWARLHAPSLAAGRSSDLAAGLERCERVAAMLESDALKTANSDELETGKSDGSETGKS